MQNEQTIPPANNQAGRDQPAPAMDAKVSLQPAAAAASPQRSRTGLWLVIALVALITIGGILIWLLVKPSSRYLIDAASSSSQKNTGASTSADTSAATQGQTAATQRQQLDTKKDYGNKYANGLLPVGDGKYTTTVAKAGYIYACSGYAQNIATTQGGAGTRGPWFVNNNTQYDINKKVHVSGSVTWKGTFSGTINGSNRVITTNDLPNHYTGIFPIASSDPAYAYDRNPNSIKSQTLTFTLPANPAYSSTPICMGGEAGAMLTGVALFNAFDAGGRDAGAWEVQDGCSGHPQSSGEYHYHTLSTCIKDAGAATVIGFALDGFPITGPKIGADNILTTTDLDVCHGITSQINLDGKSVTTYHYVMTQDFPYSVSCFRATPVQSNPPSGGGQTGQQTPPRPAQNVPPLP